MRHVLLHPVLALALALTGPAFADPGRSLELQSAGASAPAERTVFDDFARDLARRLNDGEAEALNAAFDKAAFIARATRGIPESPELADVRTGLNTGLARVGEALLQRMNSDYVFTFLRSTRRDGHVALLYRLDLGDEGLNYLELETVRRGDALRIVDWYDYATAQRYTDAVRQTLLVMLPLDRGMLDRMLGLNGVDEATVEQFLELARLQRERRFDEWLVRYDTLPAKLRHHRLMLLLRVFNANSSGSEEAYRAALDAAAIHLGDDPELSLLLVDHYLYNGQWSQAHQALDHLEDYIGRDAAIDGMRANVYLLAGEHAAARDWAQRCIEAEPGYEEAYWTRLEAHVNLGDFEAAVADLDTLEREFQYSFDAEALAALEGYEAFGRSAAFDRWASRNR